MGKQCIATSKKIRCNKTTNRTRYCKKHLKERKGLIVKKSSIPEAGLGVFAAKKFKPGDIISQYLGKVIKTLPEDSLYSFETSSGKVIDASDPNSSVSRYINDCLEEDILLNYCEGLNSEFLEKNGRVFVRAIKHIFPGQEIFCSYGKYYWD